MTGDNAVTRSTVAAVLVLAVVAASFSYQHALDVISQYSRPNPLNMFFPLTVDGLIYAASMVLLNDARRLKPHPLAYAALGLGISATLTVNVMSGLAYGPVGAAISALPAVALVFSYELLMIMIRRSASTVPGRPDTVPEPPAALNGHGHKAAELFADDLAAGEVPRVRRIKSGLGVGQARPPNRHT